MILYAIEKMLKKHRLSKRSTSRDFRRDFTHTQQMSVWYSQDGKCAHCGIDLDLRNVIYHHVKPWSLGGRTVISNCAALCPNCHQMANYRFALGKSESARSGDDDTEVE